MKIPERFSHMNTGRTFMLVTSKHEAALYEVKEGELADIGSFKVERPENTDREGEFKTRSRGQVMRSGSMFERNDTALIRDFIAEFHKLAKRMNDADATVYAFIPASVKGRITEILSSGALSFLKLTVFEGNFMHNSPIDLLEKIYPAEEAPAAPAKAEARRILSLNNGNYPAFK